MTPHAFVGVLLAALVLTAGPARATPSVGSSVGSNLAGDAGTTASGGPAAVGGPPSTLPGPVPVFVGAILDLVGQLLGGTLDALGPAVSDAAGTLDALGPAMSDAAGTEGSSRAA